MLKFLPRLVVVMLLALPRLALAETGRVGLELGGHVGDGKRVASAVLEGGVRLAAPLELAVQVPFALGEAQVFTDDYEGGVFVGNPTLGADYVLESENTKLRVGGRIALPLLVAEDLTLPDALVLAIALGMDGTRNPWLWLPDAVGVVLPWEVEHVTSDRLLLAHDGAFSLLVPVRARAEATDSLDFALQARAFVGYAHDVVQPALGVGFGWIPTLDGDGFQSFLEPRVRFLASENVHAELRMTINLDGPFGIASSDDATIWGLHAGVGTTF